MYIYIYIYIYVYISMYMYYIYIHVYVSEIIAVNQPRALVYSSKSGIAYKSIRGWKDVDSKIRVHRHRWHHHPITEAMLFASGYGHMVTGFIAIAVLWICNRQLFSVSTRLSPLQAAPDTAKWLVWKRPRHVLYEWLNPIWLFDCIKCCPDAPWCCNMFPPKKTPMFVGKYILYMEHVGWTVFFKIHLIHL